MKELYYYVDAIPSHAYGRMLYKLTQAAYPYRWLLEENARRKGRDAREFELIDTGLFDADRYFDVEVEYAKATPDDTLMRVTAHNRGPDTATIHILPQAWFRNIWSWIDGVARPRMMEESKGEIVGAHDRLGPFALSFEEADGLLFCDNDTNFQKLFGSGGSPGFYKDGINDFVVEGKAAAINPARRGTKVAGHYQREVPPGGSVAVRVRLCVGAAKTPGFAGFDALVAMRREESDAFYAVLQAGVADEDLRLVQRQAFAGMLWSKQYYRLRRRRMARRRPAPAAAAAARKFGRNSGWRHLNAADIISMPDKWEYPWFAAWDLGLPLRRLSLIDPEFAKAPAPAALSGLDDASERRAARL